MAVPLALFGLAAGAIVATLAVTWPDEGITSLAAVGSWIRAATAVSGGNPSASASRYGGIASASRPAESCSEPSS